MRIILILAACVLAGCGEGLEAQLSTCKADVRKAHVALTDRILTATGARRVDGFDALGKSIIEAHLASMKGREGLAKCRETLRNGA